MLRNYLVIAFRNIQRNKVYSAINVFGLAMGVACCLLLSLYIQDELNYDTHHNRLDDLYRITTDFKSDRGLDKLATTSPPIAMTLRDEIPEIESATRALHPPGVAQSLIKYNDNIFYETNGFIADSTLFEVLTYELVEGNLKKALVNANSVVISDELAKKLFGSEPALDKTISISQGNPSADYKITGVFKTNRKSHLQANFFTSMTSSGWGEYIRTDPDARDEWAGQNFVPAYLKLSPGHDVMAVEKKMNQVLQKYGANDMKALGMQKTLALEPVKDIYLRSAFSRSPRINYLYIIGSIAAFILLIACINFMNLSTAKATKRSAEIGIRKVMGAFRSSLIRQIMGEAMVIVLISVIISVVLVQLGLSYFNQLTEKNIELSSENIAYFASALLALIFITGTIAGSYPAFYLSSFQPAQVLKGKFNMSNSSGWLRQSLVVFQFMIAITLVCGMLIITKQLDFMQNKALGFDAKAKIVLPMRTSDARAQYDVLKNELSKNSHVHEVSGTEYIPGSHIWSDMFFYSEGDDMDKAIDIRRNTVDVGYMEMMGIRLIAGRSFTDNRDADSQSKLILNETAVKNWDLNPIKLSVSTYISIGRDRNILLK
jgi:putative ABC transport system permease protein